MMAVSFRGHWGDEIAEVSERGEYQSCVIRVVDPTQIVGGEYDYATGLYTDVTDDGTLYEGRARFIPIRFGVFQEAGAQNNTVTLQAGRVQLPRSERHVRFNTGCKVYFTESPFNGSLASRVATVTEDFQGSSSASRTFSVALDSDSVVG